MPSVSVLLPCFNSAGTLSEALDSLERQTLEDYEVIAVDDGSSDGSLEILRDWERKDRRWRVLRQAHQGIIQALNAGLRECKATYVARMDADDRARPHRLERQVEYLRTHPETAVVGCLVEAFPPGEVRQGFRVYLGWLNSLVTNEDIRKEIFVESPLPHPSVTFRKDWVERSGRYEEHGWPEDYDLWLRLHLRGARFAKVPEVLHEWRESPTRLTRTDGRYSLENFLRAKAHYLVRGPLDGKEAVVIWGAGMIGRRLSKHLEREGARLAAFVDIDPRKIGRTRRGLPIISPEELPGWWQSHPGLVVLAAVGARGARALIRERLEAMGLREGQDWWSAA
jgi:glycosyltransferase involved in cell wall biosynthesis